MTYQHKDLAERWKDFSLAEQMANIGSEVERALNWKAKKNETYSRQAFERALELLDFTLDAHQDFDTLREVARTREALVDYFFGRNEFQSTDDSWRKYFLAFNYSARRQ